MVDLLTGESDSFLRHLESSGAEGLLLVLRGLSHTWRSPPRSLEEALGLEHDYTRKYEVLDRFNWSQVAKVFSKVMALRPEQELAFRETIQAYIPQLDALARRHNEINREILEVLGSAKRSTSQSPASSSRGGGEATSSPRGLETAGCQQSDALCSALSMLRLASPAVVASQAPALLHGAQLPSPTSSSSSGSQQQEPAPLREPLLRLRALLTVRMPGRLSIHPCASLRNRLASQEERMIYSEVEYKVYAKILTPQQAAQRIKDLYPVNLATGAMLQAMNKIFSGMDQLRSRGYTV